MFVYGTLETALIAGVFAGAKSGVASYLFAILKAVPVAYLSLHLLENHRMDKS